MIAPGHPGIGRCIGNLAGSSWTTAGTGHVRHTVADAVAASPS
jgi:hypothetical protein